MSTHSRDDQSFTQGMTNSIRPFSSTHEYEFSHMQRGKDKMKQTVMSQRSGSNTSSVYENVLHSPRRGGSSRRLTRLEYLIGHKIGRKSPENCEVVADVLEQGVSVSMSARQESELVARLNMRKQKKEFESETFSHRPQITEYSSHSQGRRGDVFQNLANDVQIRQCKMEARVQAEYRSQKQMQERITRPNMKSDTMLAYKFRDEFVEAVNQLAPPDTDQDSKNSNANTYQMFTDNSMLPTDISQTISMNNFTKVLYCLGFIQTLDQHKLEQQTQTI